MYEKCEDKDHLCKATAEQKRFIHPLRTTFHSFVIKPETMQIKKALIMLHSFYSDARCEYSLIWHSGTVRKPVRQIVLESLLSVPGLKRRNPLIMSGLPLLMSEIRALQRCRRTLTIAEKIYSSCGYFGLCQLIPKYIKNAIVHTNASIHLFNDIYKQNRKLCHKKGIPRPLWLWLNTKSHTSHLYGHKTICEILFYYYKFTVFIK